MKKTRQSKAATRVVYTPEQLKTMGFDGEIAKYMREHKNTAIVGDIPGVDRCVVEYPI